jgi:peptide/nickel transport system permease protein
VVTALQRDRPVDYAGTVFSVIGISTPGFLLGILLILLFAVRLHVLPSSGYRGSALAALPEGLGAFWFRFRYFILPSVSLGCALCAVNARLMRSSMLEVLRQDYVLVARAKGIPSWAVVMRHAMRNAIIPVVTVAGLQLGTLLSGAIVTESVFAWPGMGKLLIDSIGVLDRPVIVAYLLVIVTFFIVINLVVDVLYSMLDPRVRLTELKG